MEFIEVLETWRSADAVCFDVDSTVCVDEGIDELAEFCGAGKAVAEWTARLALFFSIGPCILPGDSTESCLIYFISSFC